jgi:catechol 2,3-dioxygenase-like lactoylglutathione lyase family enzyme
VNIIGLDHVQLAMPSGGEDAARRFYGELLGLAEISKPAQLAARGGAWFHCGALQLHLGVDPSFVPATKAHPAFLVENLDQLSAALMRAGYEVKLDRSISVHRAFTEDPFGNRIELIQRPT